jgi:hypothetical protein
MSSAGLSETSVERGSTKMFSSPRIIIFGLLAFGLVGSNLEHELSCASRRETNEVVTIKGKVTIENHPELGRTEGRNIPLLFERDECNKCVIATVTDAEGRYEIYVGRGRYRVSYRDTRGGGASSRDMLAADQARYVNANSLIKPNEFNVRVMIP